MTINRNQVAQRLLDVMHNLQLTQKQLAEKLQVTQPAISKYLQGRIPPPPVLLKLSQLSGVSMEWLLTGQSLSPENNKISESQAAYGRPVILAERISLLPQAIRQQLLVLVETLLQTLESPE